MSKVNPIAQRLLMKLALLIMPIYITAQIEICDNAIDDDGDGMIDLNDQDCFCEIQVPESLIPNPSFEEQNCCPSGRSELNCASSFTWRSDARICVEGVCRRLPPQSSQSRYYLQD